MTHFPSQLKTALLIAAALRLLTLLIVADLGRDYYWEYGELAKNMVSGRGYSLFSFENDSLDHHALAHRTPYPSAYMSPGYTVVLVPFITIQHVVVRNILLVLFQTAVAVVTILLLYRLCERVLNHRTALIAAFLAALLPDFCYSVISFTPTVLYQCGIVIAMSVAHHTSHQHPPRIAPLGLIFGALMYLRFETFLFALIVAVSWTLNGHWKQSVLFIGMMILLLVPWTARNEYVFGQFIPFTTGGGLNLYRGNNGEELGSWGNPGTNAAVRTLPRDSNFEIHYNDLFLREAISYMRSHPVRTAVSAVEKVAMLWWTDPRITSHASIVKMFYDTILFGLTIAGLRRSFHRERHLPILFFFLFSTIIAAVFFVLPRHQTMMRIMTVPFAAVGIDLLLTEAARRFPSFQWGSRALEK